MSEVTQWDLWEDYSENYNWLKINTKTPLRHQNPKKPMEDLKSKIVFQNFKAKGMAVQL